MFNQVSIIGRITKDLEVRRTTNGGAVLNYTIAVNNKYNDKDETYFIRCVSFNKTAELLAQYCGKGSKLLVSGSLKTREYEKDGVKRDITEVVVDTIQFLDVKEIRTEPMQEIDFTKNLRTKSLIEKGNDGRTSWERPKVEETKDLDGNDLPF
jgi:single-strand DNA-binding protein